MNLTISVEPTSEPVTVDEQQAWSRITDEGEGDALERLIVAARHHVEVLVQRSLMTQTLVARYDSFPCEFVLERPPVQSVTSIQYIDTNGTTQALSTAYYQADLFSVPPRIVLRDGYSWPATDDQLNAVTITYVAGYASRDLVPMPIRHAISMLVDHWYENRGPVLIGQPVAEIPMSVREMLFPYRVWL